MTLAQLRYLVAVADANLNITTAAVRVNATQPGISKQLKLLEDELGFLIFARRGKSLDRVTPAGAQVIERARTMLQEASNIRALAANHRQQADGELRIVTTQTQARFFLPSALKALKDSYPGVSVRLGVFADVQRLGGADHDQVDLGVVSAVDASDANELAIPLYRWNRVALVPGDHPLVQLNRPLALADLAGFPLIGYESLVRPDSSVSVAFQTAGLTPRFAYTAQDPEIIKSYVRAGMGVGLLAEMALPGESEGPRVLDIEGLFPTCTAWALLRRDWIVREFTLDLLKRLAPHIEGRDIDRFVRNGVPLPAVRTPDWSDLHPAADSRASGWSDNVTPFARPLALASGGRT